MLLSPFLKTIRIFAQRNLKAVTWQKRFKRSLILEFRVLPLWAKLIGKTPLYILHINKAAGTSLRRAVNAKACRNGAYFPIWTPHRVGMPDIPNNHPVAFFIRQPSSRMASGFVHVMHKGAPHYTFEHSEAERRAFERFHSFQELVDGTLSGDSGRKQDALQAWTSIHHLKWSYTHFFQSVKYLHSQKQRILFVGSIEDMASDWSRFFRFLGAETPEISRLNQSSERKPLGPDADRALEQAHPNDLPIYALLKSWRDLVAGNNHPKSRT